MRLPSFLTRRREPVEPSVAARLYEDVVARAREPAWYMEGGVADTLNGRFDMVALMLSLLLLRLERIDDPAARRLLARLTERFVEDMDSSLRTAGIGDMKIGKEVGRTIGALGGRLGAYRVAFERQRGLRDALQRNVYRGEAGQEMLDWMAERVREEVLRLGSIHDRAFLSGESVA